MSENISILAASPGLDRATVEVVVTLPTFRRPEPLLATLTSLNAQQTKRRFAVIVMENDAEGLAGANAARPLFDNGSVSGLLIVAHDRGNCFAYNAGWTTALAEFPHFEHLVVIDDDEIAAPDWLEQLCSTAERHDADAVGGPQVPIFPDASSGEWARHPVFSFPYQQSGVVPALFSSGNLLVRRRLLERSSRPFLDPLFNFVGGGDSDFLSRSAENGARLAWCAEANVFETVPPRRLEADWIRARAMRNGQISTMVERRKRANEPLGRLRTLAKSLSLLAASPLRAALRYAQSGSVSIAAYPMLVGVGRVMAEFGQVHEQYRQPEKN
jgi:glycosyltransferase involved in cell wall biosynthesis